MTSEVTSLPHMIGSGAIVLDFTEIVRLLGEMTEEEAAKIPSPTGYRVLVAIPQVKKRTAGNILLPDDLTIREETASVISLVVELGPDAYKDQKKFPSGPYCKRGDFVQCRSFSGSRFKVGNVEFRFLNDDSIEGVVKDPSEIRRV